MLSNENRLPVEFGQRAPSEIGRAEGPRHTIIIDTALQPASHDGNSMRALGAVLIRADEARRRGVDVHLRHVGDGVLRRSVVLPGFPQLPQSNSGLLLSVNPAKINEL